MAQTRDGAIKQNAARLGITVDEYKAIVQSGMKRCSFGKHWCRLELFGKDRCRSDGIASSCLRCCAEKSTKRPRRKRTKQQRGRQYVEARSGDQKQARGRINHLVNMGVIADPNSIPCVDCGHQCEDMRHEYDHYKGYAAEHHECVEVRCARCHKSRHFEESGIPNEQIITFNGESMNVAQWARKLGIVRKSLAERLGKWPIEKALTLPEKKIK